MRRSSSYSALYSHRHLHQTCWPNLRWDRMRIDALLPARSILGMLDFTFSFRQLGRHEGRRRGVQMICNISHVPCSGH